MLLRVSLMFHVSDSLFSYLFQLSAADGSDCPRPVITEDVAYFQRLASEGFLPGICVNRTLSTPSLFANPPASTDFRGHAGRLHTSHHGGTLEKEAEYIVPVLCSSQPSNSFLSCESQIQRSFYGEFFD